MSPAKAKPAAAPVEPVAEAPVLWDAPNQQVVRPSRRNPPDGVGTGHDPTEPPPEPEPEPEPAPEPPPPEPEPAPEA